jgi:glyoxylase-like metal-dependent hydrolase (beta-lactamase superfamily II)
MPANPDVQGFFHDDTNTITYVVSCSETKRCAVIDPVLDYTPNDGRTATTSADAVVDFIKARGLTLEWILETHVHADHLSAGSYLRDTLSAPLAIGERVTEVQKIFGELFNAGEGFARDGSQFDRLLRDGERFELGGLDVEVLHTPGHTPACVSYQIGDALFAGDTLFMPDYGTARCDFPGGDAVALYRSIRRLLALPDETRMFLCHDYLPAGRNEYQWQTTVAAQRRGNVHIRDGIDEATFVARRQQRDAELPAPRLLLPSVQVNMRAGALPEPESNGIRYLKIPLNKL